MMPLLRYADVVLIYAEASNEVDGLNADALEALNSVRRRSNASEKVFGPAETGGIETKRRLSFSRIGRKSHGTCTRK